MGGRRRKPPVRPHRRLLVSAVEIVGGGYRRPMATTDGIPASELSEEDLLRGLEGLVPPADNGSDDEE